MFSNNETFTCTTELDASSLSITQHFLPLSSTPRLAAFQLKAVHYTLQTLQITELMHFYLCGQYVSRGTAALVQFAIKKPLYLSAIGSLYPSITMQLNGVYFF